MHYGYHSEIWDCADDEIVDEFYSGYLYTHGCDGTTVSAADFIEGKSDEVHTL